jgi:hypothetical protein
MVVVAAAAARNVSNESGPHNPKQASRDLDGVVAQPREIGTEARRMILPFQAQVIAAYEHHVCQFSVAAIIFLNFFISAAQAQILPEDDLGISIFFGFEVTFNVIFLMELIINMYANYLWPFWTNAWNVFDVVIVLVSWVSMLGDFPGVTVLRLFRAFRVFRLFKRIESLRKIIIGVTKSLPGISNALAILGLIMGVWAIMGVSFFGEDFPDEFGCFWKGMLSCVQMMTYDSWVSGISRPIVLFYSDSSVVPVYFISYAFISAIIMANVLIAILVDKYTEASQELERMDEREEKAAPEIEHVVGPQMQLAMDDARARIIENIVNIKKLYESIQHPMEDHPSEDSNGLVMDTGDANMEPPSHHDILPHQALVKSRFTHPYSQVGLAVCIMANFFAAAVQAQLKPLEGDSAFEAFKVVDYIFNALFVVELLINIYGNFFFPFFKDLWNIFDFAIVTVSLIALFGDGFDVTALRLFRAFRRSIVAFRVVRLLRLKQVKIIVLGVLKSLPGVSNAFVLLGLVMGIWSIMGVSFYCKLFPDEFGSFFKAMLTMLQIMSFDSWSSGITRPVILHDDTSDVLGGVFFIAYVFVSAIIMANVVLAILIDKFLSTAKEIQEEEMKEKEEARLAQNCGDNGANHPFYDFSMSIKIEMDKLHDILNGPMQSFIEDLAKRSH